MKSSFNFLLAVGIAHVCLATPQNVGLSFPALHLKNGKDLQDAEIKSYDTATNRVVIVSGHSMTSLQLQLLPDDVAAQILSLVPPAAQPGPVSPASAQYGSVAPRPSPTPVPQPRRSTPRAPSVVQAQPADRSDGYQAARIAQEIKTMAMQRAYHYYRYEMRPGSGSVVVTDRSVELEEPEEVQGWPGRWRVKGQISLEFYDSKGRSFNSTVGHFEVTTETNDKGTTKVVDFTPLR